MKRLLFISFILFISLNKLWAYTQEEQLKQAIGQMMMVGFSGTEINEHSRIVEQIKRYHIGGIIFDNHKNKKTGVISTNITNPEQLKKIIAQLQKYSLRYSGYPLLIAINQEGGLVNTLKPSQGFANENDPSQFSLGQNQQQIFPVTYTRALLLKKLGINLNLAPVADLNINPDNPAIGKFQRSFGSNVKAVTQDLSLAISAYKKTGVFCTLKHFPGLGSANANTDYSKADVTLTWQKDELKPYQSLIDENNICDFIMISHVINKQLDESGLPLSLSKKVVTQLLKKQMHFDGIVITDDMDAVMIRQHYLPAFAIQQAVLAGNDILIYGGTQGYNPEADTDFLFKTIYRLAKQHPVIRQQVMQSAKKITDIKKQYLLNS